MSGRKVGRPRVSSQEVLAEAACELFLEQGFERTSIADIARRAGVSRSSFFNYASSKSGLLWMPLDHRIAAWDLPLIDASDVAGSLRAALADLAEGVAPDALALVIAQADAMGMRDEAEREGAVRLARIAVLLETALRSAGVSDLHAAVVSVAWAGAFIAGLRTWAARGAAATTLSACVDEAVDVLGGLDFSRGAGPISRS